MKADHDSGTLDIKEMQQATLEHLQHIDEDEDVDEIRERVDRIEERVDRIEKKVQAS